MKIEEFYSAPDLVGCLVAYGGDFYRVVNIDKVEALVEIKSRVYLTPNKWVRAEGIQLVGENHKMKPANQNAEQSLTPPIKFSEAALKCENAKRLDRDYIKTCKTCAFRDIDGYCQSEKIAESCTQSDDESSDMLLYSYSVGGIFWVGENFGCVHHQEKIASEEGKQ